MKKTFLFLLMLLLIIGVSPLSVLADSVTTQDLEDEHWTSKASCPVENYFGVSANVGGKIYVFGGQSVPWPEDVSNCTYPNEIRVYDTVKDTWSLAGTLPFEGVSSVTATPIGNKIYLIGSTKDNKICQVNIYDTETGTWSKGTDLGSTRGSHAAIYKNGVIYIIGGYDGSKRTNKVNCYNVSSDIWTTKASMHTARDLLAAACIENKIYTFDGYNAGDLNVMEIYDIATDTWSSPETTPIQCSRCRAIASGDKIYLVGGCLNSSRKGLNNVNIYNTSTGTWSTGPSTIDTHNAYNLEKVGNYIYALNGNTSGSVECIKIGNSSPALKVLLSPEESVQLSLNYSLRTNSAFSWTSTDESVATVDSQGKVTAIDEGEAYIYATSKDGSFSQFIPVKVMENADDYRLAIHLNPNGQAKLYLSDDVTKAITWSSADNTIATVNNKGVVTAVNTGLALINAELDGQIYSIYVRVHS